MNPSNVNENAATEASPTVYIIEDDEAVRDSFAAMLGACGVPARGFGSAEEYLAARGSAPDGCLLLDLNLPGMDGLALLEHRVYVPTVIVTARRDSRVDERASKAGAVAVFDKPADRQALLSAVRTALRQHAPD